MRQISTCAANLCRIATSAVPNSKLRLVQNAFELTSAKPFHNGCSPQARTAVHKCHELRDTNSARHLGSDPSCTRSHCAAHSPRADPDFVIARRDDRRSRLLQVRKSAKDRLVQNSRRIERDFLT